MSIACVVLFWTPALAQDIPAAAVDNNKVTQSEDTPGVADTALGVDDSYYKIVSYTFKLLDRDGRPLQCERGKSQVVFRLLGNDGLFLNGSDTIKVQNIELSLAENGQNTIAKNVESGNLVKVSLLAPTEDEVKYDMSFNSKQPEFAKNTLRTSLLSVKAAGKDNRNESLYLTQVHRSTAEYIAAGVFFLTALLLGWFVSTQQLSAALVRGRGLKPLQAQSISTIVLSALLVTAIVCLGVAFAWPGVDSPHFPFFNAAISAAVYFLIVLLVWISAITMDRRH